jgi:DNA-binding transcriptional LysR family regulator
VNTDLLRTFLEVAKTRHFGRAAENLYLTQSTVSARIKHLEELLGVVVFSRQRNNILLTSAGERLLPHAENLLAAWQHVVQEVGIPAAQSLQIALGGTHNLWDTFLQSLLPELAQQFPQLHIRTEINRPQHLIRALLAGRLDLSVVLDAPTNIELDYHPVGELDLIMVCNRCDVTLEEIPAQGYVFVDWGTAANLQQARLFPEPVAPILHAAQCHIALEFILHYQGAAYLPRATVANHLDAGRLYPIADAPQARQEVYLVYSREAGRPDTLGPVIELIKRIGQRRFGEAPRVDSDL